MTRPKQPDKPHPPRSAKEVLLGPGPRFEDIVPVRGRLRRRPPIKFK